MDQSLVQVEHKGLFEAVVVVGITVWDRDFGSFEQVDFRDCLDEAQGFLEILIMFHCALD
jgi:hypothetical protein